MKKTLLTVTSLSLLLNAYLLVRELDIETGSGTVLQSPDMKHTASLMSHRNLNPLSADRSRSAVISIYDGYVADECIRTVRMNPISESSDHGFRDLDKPIQWSEDSQEATITTPDLTLTINLTPKIIKRDKEATSLEK